MNDGRMGFAVHRKHLGHLLVLRSLNIRLDCWVGLVEEVPCVG